jgi:putative aldouronate transport system substrate-binding protein
MKSKVLKRALALTTTVTLVMGTMAGCGGAGNSTSADTTKADTAEKAATTTAKEETASQTPAAESTDDTFIADRTVVIQAYVDDIGYSLPEDTSSSPVFQEIKKRTGIDIKVQYTPGDSDSAILSSQLAAGNIPDVIVCYLNNSTRKEFPILLKAAKEGMFADVTEYMKNSKVYSKYMEKGYLPDDTYNNICFREDLDGTYLMHLAIPAVDRSTEFDPDTDYVGGMWIQKSIAEALNVDVKNIRTQDDFYNLLVSIKEGGFKDDNGNAVYPLGPKYWGGSTDTLDYIVRGYDWGVSDGYNLADDGTVKHEIETEYAWNKVAFLRKLLAEDLINPEFFTMDSTRAEEVSRTHNSAIMADCHNYQDIIYESGDWIPLGPLNDISGSQAKVVSGKGGYGCWAISSEASNPEEIFKLFDYLSTEEGQLLCEYGVEGVSYNMVDGKPVLTDEVQQHLDNGDTEWLVNSIGAGFGGSGCVFFDFVLTDTDSKERFGESRPGSSSASTFDTAVSIAKEYPVTYSLVKGLNATAYLNAESMTEVKAQMSLLNYKETLVQAAYADSDATAQKILDSFKSQMEAAGLAQFEEYVKSVYDGNKDAVNFYK